MVAIMLMLAKTSAVLYLKKTLTKGPVKEARGASALIYSTGRYIGFT